MDTFYERYIAKENEYYRTLPVVTPYDVELKPSELNDALNWLIDGSCRIVDFGCGSGALSIICALRGAEAVLGIDLAEDGIRFAQNCAAEITRCEFRQGSVELLQQQRDQNWDGVILSNILDNMKPEDALLALKECARILRSGGKILIKLNPFLTQEQITAWKIQRIAPDLLDDGFLLWNREDSFWKELLENTFSSVVQREVYYPEFDKRERLFCCVK